MMKSWMALVGAGVALAACASAPHGRTTTLAGAATACADQGGCGSRDPGHRQYYDEHAHRYYYYDGASGRYFWEDGAPRD